MIMEPCLSRENKKAAVIISCLSGPFNFFWGLTPPFNFDGGVL